MYCPVCTSCGKKHHFAAVCRSQKSQGQVPGQSSSFRHHVQSFQSISPRERQCPRVNVMIATGTFSHSHNLGEFLATPDTGADVTSRDGYNSTCWDSLATNLRLLLDRRSLLRTASRWTVSARAISSSTLAPALLLIGSQSLTRWMGYFWHGTWHGTWETFPTTTPPL